MAMAKGSLNKGEPVAWNTREQRELRCGDLINIKILLKGGTLAQSLAVKVKTVPATPGCQFPVEAMADTYALYPVPEDSNDIEFRPEIDQVILHLSAKEAEVLSFVMRSIGGDSMSTARKYTDAIYAALRREADVPDVAYETGPAGQCSITFK